jgi:hypothetical protein
MTCKYKSNARRLEGQNLEAGAFVLYEGILAHIDHEGRDDGAGC